MMRKVNKGEFNVDLKSRRASMGGGQSAQHCVCLLVSAVVRAEALSNECSTQYICMLHYKPPSVHLCLLPSLTQTLSSLSLSFFLQQSTDSLSCQSKPTFIQPIINDTIHLAWSLSLSSALFLFHPPLVWKSPLKTGLSINVTSKVLWLTWGSRGTNLTSVSHFTCRSRYPTDRGRRLRTGECVSFAFVILCTEMSRYNDYHDDYQHLSLQHTEHLPTTPTSFL